MTAKRLLHVSRWLPPLAALALGLALTFALLILLDLGPAGGVPVARAEAPAGPLTARPQPATELQRSWPAGPSLPGPAHSPAIQAARPARALPVPVPPRPEPAPGAWGPRPDRGPFTPALPARAPARGVAGQSVIPTIAIWLTGDCFYGYTAPGATLTDLGDVNMATGASLYGYTAPGTTLTATLRSGATVKGLAVALVDGAGWLGNTAFYAGGRVVDIAAGDTVDFYVDGVKTTVTLPSITGQVTPATDVVAGTIGGVTAPVTLTIRAHGRVRSVATDGSGHYSTDWTGTADIVQDDQVDVAYQVAAGYMAVASFFPQNGYTVYETWNGLYGYTVPGRLVTVTLRTSSGALKEAGSVRAGAPLGDWWYQAGADVVPGDRVSVRIGGTTLSSLVSAISGQVYVLTDTVQGRSPASSPVQVSFWRRDGTASQSLEMTVNATAAGRYSAKFDDRAIGRWRSWANVTHADNAYADTSAFIAAPYAQVNLSWGDVWGYAAPGAQVAITLTGATGEVRKTQAATARIDGYYKTGLDDRLWPGDTVQVVGRGISATIPITTLGASADRDSDTVNGRGPADAEHLRVSLYGTGGNVGGPPYEQGAITTTAAGRFSAVLPGIDLHDDAGGEVHYHTGDNPDEQVQAAQFWTPYLQVAAGGSWVSGRALMRPNLLVTLTLQGPPPASTVKATAIVTQVKPPQGWFDAEFRAGEALVNVEPGDVVLMDTGEYTSAVTAVGIDAAADPATDVVSGTASPWSVVWVTVDWGNACPFIYVPADGSGHFAAYLGDWYDVQPLDRVQVGVKEPSFDDSLREITAPGLRLDVNQDHDWVNGETSPGATVWITVTDRLGAVKGTGEAVADGGNGGCTVEAYADGQRTDIAPTDVVFAASSDGARATATVLTMTGRVDAGANTVAGAIQGGTFPARVLAMVWEKDGPEPVEGTTDSSGHYLLDLSPYDLQKGQQVAVEYYEPDGDGIIIVRNGLCLRANYGDDLVETNYEPGHTIWITVTDSAGELKAATTGTTGPVEWWGGQSGFSTDLGSWLPARPDIAPGDIVSGAVDNGDQTSVRIGTITGYLDVAADTITGTVSAPWFADPLWGWAKVCEQDGPWTELSFSPDGWSYEWGLDGWDLQPRQNVAVAYQEPDRDEVINVFHEPAPDLVVNTWAVGGQAAPGGPAVYGVQCRNDGDAAGEATLTATLPANTGYLADSSGFPATVGEGVVTWSLGSLEPYTRPLQFYLVLTNTASPGDRLLNRMEIGTPAEVNWKNNAGEAEVEVGADGARPNLNVGKRPNPGDPAPGQLFQYQIDYGNQGPVASGPVWLTDTLPLSTTFVGLAYEDNNYSFWTAVVTTGGQVALYSPALPGGSWGGRLWLTLRLDDEVGDGAQLTNTVEISTALEADPGDNTCTNNDARIKGPRYDASVDTWWGHGSLAPGSQANFWLQYGNGGNSVVHGAVLTDTLPAGTTFITSALDLGWGFEAPFPPDHRVGNQLVWELGDLPVNAWQNVRLQLSINPGTPPGAVLTNSVTIGSAGPDPNPYNNAAHAVETVRPAGPNLRVTKAGWWEGQGNAYFGVRLCNIGTTTIYDVAVTDTIPVSMTVAKRWLDYWGEGHCGDSGRLITATLDRLEPGWTVWLHTQLSAPGVPSGLLFTNTAEITTPPGDVYPADNRDLLALGSGPDLRIAKWLSGGTPLPGQLLTYTLHVENPSPWEPQGAVWVTDTLPAGVELVSAHERCGADLCPRDPDVKEAGKVAWRYDKGWSWWWSDLLLTVRISDTTHPGTRLINSAVVASDSPDDVEPLYGNNRAEVTTLVEGRLYLPVVLP